MLVHHLFREYHNKNLVRRARRLLWARRASISNTASNMSTLALSERIGAIDIRISVRSTLARSEESRCGSGAVIGAIRVHAGVFAVVVLFATLSDLKI